MSNLSSSNAAEGYRQTSLSVQRVVGEKFIQTDVCPQAGDAILDLGCGTGELSAYLAELVGPEGKVVAVDPDKERILLAQQSFGEVKNLSFVEGSASNFPGIGSQSYDIVFSNQVIHWIPDKEEVFKNVLKSLKKWRKISRSLRRASSFFCCKCLQGAQSREHRATLRDVSRRRKGHDWAILFVSGIPHY